LGWRFWGSPVLLGGESRPLGAREETHVCLAGDNQVVNT
jgi:hypothetical protein